MVLPGSPPKALSLDLGLVVSLRVRSAHVHRNVYFRSLVSQTESNYTLVFKSFIKSETRYRRPTHPYARYLHRVVKDKLPYTVRYVEVYSPRELKKVSPRKIHEKLLAHAIRLDKHLSLYHAIDYFKTINPFIEAIYYISKKKIVKLDGTKRFENARYMIWNRYYIILLS